VALRFSPMDFKPRSRDGMGDDWPITYEELAPYYDKVESYIGVFGTKENIPSSPDFLLSYRGGLPGVGLGLSVDYFSCWSSPSLSSSSCRLTNGWRTRNSTCGRRKRTGSCDVGGDYMQFAVS
jgi:choline dehydrogenase-like flavoprotein